MKYLVILVALGAGAYYFGPNIGLFGSSTDPAAIAAYKKFANAYVINDFETAHKLASGQAATLIEREQNEPYADMLKNRGILERAHFDLTREDVSASGQRIEIEALHRAAVSMPGRTANPNSPGAYVHHRQTATVERSGGEWAVTEFSDEIVHR